MRGFCDDVRAIGAKVAYDDFGAGQSRLLELVKAPPDYLKFDASLIREIHQASGHQRRMLQFLVQMAADVPTIPLAEGIEKLEEADICLDLGFRLAQGYFFGRPAPAEVCASETHPLTSASATATFTL
jgi:EAL domain-containing protein (putative c-di-GMP-specific phosphodiesterase class I)